MILITKTFSEITPESAEYADFSNSGIVYEKESVSFRELVCLMVEHFLPSNSGDISKYTYFSSGYFISDYFTATEREYTIHFHNDNLPQFEKYWELAAKVAINKIKHF